MDVDPGRSGVPVQLAEDLRSFVQAASRVVARDAAARPLALPAAVRQFTRPDQREARAETGWVHAADRPRLVTAWSEALLEPGGRSSVDMRQHRPEGWMEVRARFWNLLHVPAIGAVLIALELLGPAADTIGVTTDGRAQVEAPEWVVQHLDLTGAVVRTAGDVESFFGVRADELVGRNVLDFVHPDDLAAAVAMWRQVIASPLQVRVIHQRLRRADGSVRWVESTVMHSIDAPVAPVVAVSIDGTHRRLQDEALRRSEAAFRLLAEDVPVGVFRADAVGSLTYINRHLLELARPFGNLARVVDLVAPEEVGRFEQAWAGVTDGVGFDLVIRSHGGRRLRMKADRSDAEGPVAIVGTVEDVTDAEEAIARLRRQAERDALTGLFRRDAFDTRLADALARPGDPGVVVLFVDLDDFKMVNDRAGHEAGDRALVAVARALLGAVRPQDVVARYGGDEFVVLCQGVVEGEEEALVLRLRHAVGRARIEPSESGGWRPAASIGVARAGAGEQPEELLVRADRAMYEVKRRRNERPT